MAVLNFDPELCFSCESYACLTKCQYLNFDLNKAKEERIKLAKGEYSDVLKECVNCYACEEYCPYNNHPFYRIVELQEKFGINPAPEDVIRGFVLRYQPQGVFKPKEIKGRPIHLCLFPEFKSMIQGKLFENMTIVRGRHIFCNLLFLHFARSSIIKERATEVIKNVSSFGKEIVLFHDECYGFYTSFAEAYNLEVPFKPIHLFEHLYQRLKENEDKIQKLDLKIAYQRPCSNRLSPETDKILDKVFDIIGVERVEREYDRENALCCGVVFTFLQKEELTRSVQRKNIEDILNSKASHVVFNCPMCYLTLAEKVRNQGLTPIMISELCKMAIGERPVLL